MSEEIKQAPDERLCLEKRAPESPAPHRDLRYVAFKPLLHVWVLPVVALGVEGAAISCLFIPGIIKHLTGWSFSLDLATALTMVVVSMGLFVIAAFLSIVGFLVFVRQNPETPGLWFSAGVVIVNLAVPLSLCAFL